MISNYEKSLRQFQLWKIVSHLLIDNDKVLQAKIVEEAEEKGLGSRKFVINILNELVDNKILVEMNQKIDKPGRPKKYYQLNKNKQTEPILINLAEFPKPLREFINKQVTEDKDEISKTVTEVVLYLFIYYMNTYRINAESDKFIEKEVNRVKLGDINLSIKLTNKNN